MDKTVENKYALEAPTFRCLACSSEIPEGATYISSIRFGDAVFHREETCESCWSRAESPDEGVFAFWKTARPEAQEGPARRRRFDIELVWAFFLNLHEDVENEEEEPEIDPELLGEGAPESEAGEAGEFGEEGEVEDEVADAEEEGDEGEEDDSDSLEIPVETEGVEFELDPGEDPDDWEEFEFEIELDEDEDDEDGDPDAAAESLESAAESPEGESSTDDPGEASPGRSAHSTREGKVRLLFLLSLLLMRGKRLDLRETLREEGREVLNFTARGNSEDLFRVEDPRLGPEDLEEVKDALGELLQMQI